MYSEKLKDYIPSTQRPSLEREYRIEQKDLSIAILKSESNETQGDDEEHGQILKPIPANHRTAVTFLKNLHEKFNQIVYARTDRHCQSLLRPNSNGYCNFFDYESAKANKLRKRKSRYNWIKNEFVERNFANNHGLEFGSCFENGNLSMVWHAPTHPSTFYLEISPDTNSNSNEIASNGNFMFSVTYSKRPKVPLTFRIMNVRPLLKRFSVLTKSSHSHTEWKRTSEGRGFDNLKEWIVVYIYR